MDNSTDPSWDRAWDDRTLDAALAELADGDIGPACAVLAEAREQPEVRSLRLEVLAERLVGAGDRVLELAMDEVNPELVLLAGAVALREARVIADGPLDPNALKVAAAYQRRSFGLLAQAAEDVDTDPVPHELALSIVAGLRPADADAVWGRVAKRCPTFYTGHRTRVSTLAPTDALAFARATARAAGSGDPRAALVVLAHFLGCRAKAAEFLAAGKNADGALLNARWETFRNPRSGVPGEIAELSQRYLAAARPHPRAIEAHNLFAAAFSAMGSPELSEPHLRLVVGKPSAWAWRWAGGEEGYNSAQQALRGIKHPDLAPEVRNHPLF
ncbi:hypothetical protein ACFPM7_18355 [Actinokineospora guangxiensis]|uniref:Tetratricopeptide repeat protein n=1 Tax=Actinokineospora guangxiensis TaxID=1490288 RepID=A0ABW0ERL4_9PSEU